MNTISFEKKRFLIVEDSRATRIAMVKLLAPLGDPQISNAENGLEAISMLSDHSHEVDCIICDFNMPVMHGLTMVKEVRTGSHDIRREIPILMIISHSDRNLLGLALALDVNGFLIKPLTKEVFITRLNRILQQTADGKSWVKPEDSYRWIDVETAIQPILQKPSTKSQDYSIKRINEAITKAKDRQRMKTQIQNTLKNQAGSAGASTPGSRRLVNSETPVPRSLRYITPYSVLARDLLGKNGQKLLGMNTTLTEEMLDRLKDLSTMGEDLNEIWIYPADPRSM